MTDRAEIIAVGTELLLGNIANTDAQYLSQQLSAVGVDVLYHTVVGDNPGRLRQAVAVARERCNLLIFTGGLGPTDDDLTKETVCAALDVPLVDNEEAAESIRRYFGEVLGRPVPAGTLDQARLPAGCTVLPNAVGTAPGCIFEKDGLTVALLPGVPVECRYLTETGLIPWLRRRAGGVILSHELRTFGLTEPQVQEMFADLIAGAVNPSLAPYAKTGEVLLRLTAKGTSAEDCEEKMAPLFWDVRARLGEYLYGVDVESLAQQTLRLLKRAGLTFSAAESCTGGLIAKEITDLPGASTVFAGGVVSYTDGVKAGVLGVEEELLKVYGAVSEEVARAMAEGVRRLTGSDLAVSVTGLAGPDRDDRGNEVGTVFVALSAPEGTAVRRLHLGAGRGRVRTLSAHHAFDLLRRYLTGLPLDPVE